MRGFWRGLILFLFGGVLGTGFGMVLGFFLFPFVFPPPPAAEQLAEADRAPALTRAPGATTSPAPATGGAPGSATQSSLVAAGNFIHANPSDPIHWGKGKVSLYERAVFLEPDFEVGPGPAFHVYLVPKPNIRREADVSTTM